MLLQPWRHIYRVRQVSCHIRNLVTETNKNEEAILDTPKAKREKKKNAAVSKEISWHFKDPDRQFVLKSFQEDLLKKKRRVMQGLYVANRDTAKVIADKVTKDLRPDQSLIEMNPGIGLVTKHLLEETENHLLLYEPDSQFQTSVSNLMSAYPNRKTTLNKADLNLLWQMMYLDNIDKGTRITRALSEIHRKDFDGLPNARLFAATTSSSFLHHLINSVVTQSSIMAYGRCELYLCLTPPLFRILTCPKEIGYLMYRASTVLFQLLFEYEYLGKFDRKDFLPWQYTIKDAPHLKLDHSEQDTIYFLKAVPRQDMHRFCPPENMKTLSFFLKQHLRSRSNRVIPTIEQWIPGSGPRLFVNSKKTVTPDYLDPNIDLTSLPYNFEPCRKLSNEDYKTDINIMTEFGDMTPSQVLTLFDQFVNWPEFKESSFNASLQSMLLKLNTCPEDAIDDLDLPADDEMPIVKPTENTT